jgi:hypothetical protein
MIGDNIAANHTSRRSIEYMGCQPRYCISKIVGMRVSAVDTYCYPKPDPTDSRFIYNAIEIAIE